MNFDFEVVFFLSLSFIFFFVEEEEQAFELLQPSKLFRFLDICGFHDLLNHQRLLSIFKELIMNR